MVGQLKPDKPDVVATFSILIIGSERSWCTLLIEQKCHELLLIQSYKQWKLDRLSLWQILYLAPIASAR